MNRWRGHQNSKSQMLRRSWWRGHQHSKSQMLRRSWWRGHQDSKSQMLRWSWWRGHQDSKSQMLRRSWGSSRFLTGWRLQQTICWAGKGYLKHVFKNNVFVKYLGLLCKFKNIASFDFCINELKHFVAKKQRAVYAMRQFNMKFANSKFCKNQESFAKIQRTTNNIGNFFIGNYLWNFFLKFIFNQKLMLDKEARWLDSNIFGG